MVMTPRLFWIWPNTIHALLGLVAGWAIYASGSNFLVGFSIGMGMSTVGLLMFYIRHRLMKV